MSQTIDIVVQLTGLSAIVTVPAVQLPSNGNGGPVSWEQVNGKPSTFPPSAHQHVMDDVQGLLNALAGKAASIHSHEIADIIGLALALADKANVSDLQNKADLVGGVIPTSQIPATAITEFLGSVNSEVAMLALDGQKGDWCIRTDQNRTYFIVGDNGSVLANWRFIETPASPVASVNGQVGVVVLGKGDVGLPNVDNTSDMAKPVSTAQAAALAGKANTSHFHSVNEINGFVTGVMESKLPTFSAGITDPVVTGDDVFLAIRKLQGQINARALASVVSALRSCFPLSVFTATSIVFPANATRWYAINGLQANATVTSSELVARRFVKGGIVSDFQARVKNLQPASGAMVLEIFAGEDPAALSGTGIILTVAAGSNGDRVVSSNNTYNLTDGHYMAVRIVTSHTSGNSAQLVGFSSLLGMALS